MFQKEVCLKWLSYSLPWIFNGCYDFYSFSNLKIILEKGGKFVDQQKEAVPKSLPWPSDGGFSFPASYTPTLLTSLL